MAIDDLDFHNYIYLFNDPNQVVLSFETPGSAFDQNVPERAGLFFSAYNTVFDQYASVSGLLSEAGISIDSNMFNEEGVYGDVPVFTPGATSFVTELRKEYRPPQPALENEDTSFYFNGQFIDTNIAYEDLYLAYFRSSNDLGLSPFNRHNLYVDGDVIKYRYSSVADVAGSVPVPNVASIIYYHINYPLPIGGGQGFGKSDIENKKASTLGNSNTGILFSNNADQVSPWFNYAFTSEFKNWPHLNLEPYDNSYGNNFTYTQDVYLTIKTQTDIDPYYPYPDQNPNVIQATHYTDFVNDHFENKIFGVPALGGINSLNSPRKIVLDAATKIGVPYDVHTVVKEETNLQNYGVKNATPSYKSVYNYYDFQYEPVMVKAISSNIIGENALPSIYDFLFLPKQFTTLSTFLELGHPPIVSFENFNLSNLDEYLNKLSSLYASYTSEPFSDSEVTDDSEFPQKYLYEFSYQNDGAGSADSTNLSTTSAPAAIFNTNKNLFLSQMKNAATNAAAGKLRSNVILSKADHVPKWLEDVKKGIYFSEKSFETFNQAEQFKNNFPFYMEIDIPTEAMGPIAKLLSENDLLDSINTHAASATTPIPFAEEFSTLARLTEFDERFASAATVGTFYGGMFNGHNNQLFNLFEQVKMKTFRMYFTNFSPARSSAGIEDQPNDDPFYYTGDAVLLDDELVGGQAAADVSEPGIAQGLDGFISPVDIFLNTFQDLGLESPKNVFTYSENEESLESSFAQLLKQLQGNAFVESMKSLFIDKNLLRKPSEIQHGKLAHQETLMYEIAKYDDSNNYIQSIFIPISNLININYIDTQVVPYKNYHYKIFAHKVIVGTKYRMAPFVKDDDGNYIKQTYQNQNLYQHHYWVQPYLQFVRVPYYNVPLVNVTTDELNLSRIEDLPPLEPQVQIVPYKGINNKLLFLFNSSTGESTKKPITIFDTDVQLFTEIAISQQKAMSAAGDVFKGVTFKGDDPLSAVEIFRVENPLSDYKDILGDTTLFTNTITTDDAASTSYVDTIKPNKNYYYFFRAVDIHGKISNPTAVYKIKMISDVNTAPYLKVELFSFVKPDKFMESKPFQKYLLLEPNSDQKVVDYPDLGANLDGLAIGDHETQDVTLGPKVGSVFGNKYKLRITSKQTGRKIDVNVTVKEPKNIINDI